MTPMPRSQGWYGAGPAIQLGQRPVRRPRPELAVDDPADQELALGDQIESGEFGRDLHGLGVGGIVAMPDGEHRALGDREHVGLRPARLGHPPHGTAHLEPALGAVAQQELRQPDQQPVDLAGRLLLPGSRH